MPLHSIKVAGMTPVRGQAVSTSSSLSPKTFFTVPDIWTRGCGILRECLSFSSHLHVHYYISLYAIPHIMFTFLCCNVSNILFTGSSRESAMCDRHDEKVPAFKQSVAAYHLFRICSLLKAATPLHVSAMQDYWWHTAYSLKCTWLSNDYTKQHMNMYASSKIHLWTYGVKISRQATAWIRLQTPQIRNITTTLTIYFLSINIRDKKQTSI
jgi:hypothetical protein